MNFPKIFLITRDVHFLCMVVTHSYKYLPEFTLNNVAPGMLLQSPLHVYVLPPDRQQYGCPSVVQVLQFDAQLPALQAPKTIRKSLIINKIKNK